GRAGLKMPSVFARFGIHCDDTAGEKAVARGFDVREFAVIRAGSGSAKNDEAGGVIVGDRVPNVAAPYAPPLVAVPSLRRHFESFGFEFFRGISGNRPEAPDLIAGVRVVGDESAADAIVGAVIADKNSAFGNVGRAGDSGLHWIADRSFPSLFSSCCVYRDETAVARTDKNPSIPDGDAAVSARGIGTIDGHIEADARIEFPEKFSSCGIRGINFRLRRADISDAVHDDGFGDDAH